MQDLLIQFGIGLVVATIVALVSYGFKAGGRKWLPRDPLVSRMGPVGASQESNAKTKVTAKGHAKVEVDNSQHQDNRSYVQTSTTTHVYSNREATSDDDWWVGPLIVVGVTLVAAVFFISFYEYFLVVTLGVVVGLIVAAIARVRRSMSMHGTLPHSGRVVLSLLIAGVVLAVAVWIGMSRLSRDGVSVGSIRSRFDASSVAGGLADQFGQRWSIFVGLGSEGVAVAVSALAAAVMVCLMFLPIISLLRRWSIFDRAGREVPQENRMEKVVRDFEDLRMASSVVGGYLLGALITLACGLGWLLSGWEWVQAATMV